MSTYISADLRRIIHKCAEACCEYCLIPESITLAPHEIDHIIAQKHQGKTEPDNLALSCNICNKHKGSDIASINHDTGNIIALYHPRRDIWTEHFKIEDAQILPLTPTGEVTVRLLQFNSMNRVQERTLLIETGLIKLPKQKRVKEKMYPI